MENVEALFEDKLRYSSWEVLKGGLGKLTTIFVALILQKKRSIA